MGRYRRSVIVPPESGEVKKVRMNIQASLVLDDSISKAIEDVITVRNDFLSRTLI